MLHLLLKLSIWVGVGAFLVMTLNGFLTPDDKLKRADVIVAISGGDTTARTTEAIRLFQAGWAPKLIFSGAAKDTTGPSNAKVMRDIARAQNVPATVIEIDELAQNTRDNANKSGEIVKRAKYQSIILVTSPYHQRRAYLEFREKLGPDVEIINHSAPDQSWPRRWWWMTPNGWYLTLSESLKTLVTWLRPW